MLPMAFSFILQPLQTVSSLMAINSVNIRSSPEHKKKTKKKHFLATMLPFLRELGAWGSEMRGVAGRKTGCNISSFYVHFENGFGGSH